MKKTKPLTSSYCVLSQLYVLAWTTFCILASASRTSLYTTLFFLEGKLLENKECFSPLHTQMIQDSIFNTVGHCYSTKWLNRMEHFQCQLRYTGHIQFKRR